MTFSPSDANTYGKKVDELQSGITVGSDGTLYGTLHYVTGYKGFDSKNAALQKGNFLAMEIDATAEETVKYTSSTSGKGEQTMKPNDRTLVWRVQDNDATMTIKIEGDETREQTYKAKGLTLEKA